MSGVTRVFLDDFVEGVPRGLQRHLQTFRSPVPETNIPFVERKRSVVGYVPLVGIETAGGAIGTLGIRGIHLFFPREQDSVNVPLFGYEKGFFVSLDVDKYGFSKERTCSLDPRKIDFDLSKTAKETYEHILVSGQMPVQELLGGVGSMANSSIAYDYDMMAWAARAAVSDEFMALQIEKLRDENPPTGEEESVGFPDDVGKLIRSILFSLGLERRYGFSLVSTDPHDGVELYHDSTLFFDKETSEWALLNARCSVLPYDVVPKIMLPDVGGPFSRIERVYSDQATN